MTDHPSPPTNPFPHFTHYPGDPLADRDLWQRDAFPPLRLRDLSVTVLGLNAVGRQTALMLASLGVPRLEVVDPDTVMPVHLNSEGYLEYDLASAKCDAVAMACLRRNSRVHLRPRMQDPAGYDAGTPICEVVLCCVPDFAVKRRVYEAVRDRCGFFADARVLGERVEVVACSEGSGRTFDPRLDDHALDPRKLGPADPKGEGRHYTQLIHTAGVAAGLMVAQLGCCLRGQPVVGLTGLDLTHGR